jgi:hypothetical protein
MGRPQPGRGSNGHVPFTVIVAGSTFEYLCGRVPVKSTSRPSPTSDTCSVLTCSTTPPNRNHMIATKRAVARNRARSFC